MGIISIQLNQCNLTMSEAKHSFSLYCCNRRTSRHEIVVGPNTWIDAVRAHVATESGIPEKQTQLMCENEALDSNKQIKDYPQLTEGVFIWFRQLNNKL